MDRIFIGIDDTDTLDADHGTGKLARWFKRRLPEGCRLWGVVRQQLLVHDDVPYTSHNSSACVVVDGRVDLDQIIQSAVAHIERHAFKGSDPGVCVARAGNPALAGLAEFGYACTRRIVTQREAFYATATVHLSGHGGTYDGVIGAAAAVGLTACGWSGRLIDYNDLRRLGPEISVRDLNRRNVDVVSIDRDARVPQPWERIQTNFWLRPRLMGNRPILLVSPDGNGGWTNIGKKRFKKEGDPL